MKKNSIIFFLHRNPKSMRWPKTKKWIEEFVVLISNQKKNIRRICSYRDLDNIAYFCFFIWTPLAFFQILQKKLIF
jgi:hypothetical protein